MIRPYLPLNGLRAFEAAARHLSFTRAAIELSVTPAALSHQVKALEDRLGRPLFRRIPRGLALTDEGAALLPVLRDALDRIADALARLAPGAPREIVSVGAVGTFAVGWLLPRLARFHSENPGVEVRLSTNNNRVDIAEEGLDFAIRFGDGAWHATDCAHLMDAPLTPLCTPELATRLGAPDALLGEVLLRSYRAEDWASWLRSAGVDHPPLTGPVFDSARVMVDAALRGGGVALAPPAMFEAELEHGRLVRPFAIEVPGGAYWLTWLKSRDASEGALAFQRWIVEEARLSVR
jgi:LysR family transcriptional regulator of beta-lactamase